MELKDKICMILSIVLLAVLAVLYVDYREEQQEKKEYLIQLTKDISVYSKQIEAVNADLAKKKEEMNQEEKQLGGFALAVKAASLEELEQAAEMLGDNAEPLTVVLDIELEEDTLTAILEALKEYPQWDVMLTGTEEDWLTEAAAFREKLEEFGLTDTGFAYFTEGKLTESQKRVLATDDWQGYSVSLGSLAEKPAVTIEDGEPIQIGHVLLAEENALIATITETSASGSIFLLSIEMELLNQSFEEATVERIIDKINTDYIENGVIKQISIQDYLAEYEAAVKAKAQKQKAYDTYVKEKQAELESLQEQMSTIKESTDW